MCPIPFQCPTCIYSLNTHSSTYFAGIFSPLSYNEELEKLVGEVTCQSGCPIAQPQQHNWRPWPSGLPLHPYHSLSSCVPIPNYPELLKILWTDSVLSCTTTPPPIPALAHGSSLFSLNHPLLPMNRTFSSVKK